MTSAPDSSAELLADQASLLELIARNEPVEAVFARLVGIATRHLPAVARVTISLVGATPPDAATWSAPIVAPGGAILGSLDATTTRPLRPAERALLDLLGRYATLALDRERAVDAALGQSRARFEYAVRLSGVGFWYCDLPFDELIWDVRVKQHFFLPADARVTIELFYDRIHADDREPTRTAIDTSIATRTSYDVVYRTVDPATGAIKWIRALGGAVYATDGSPVRFDGVTVDVTTEKLDQQRLARVADAALEIHSASALDAVLRVVTERARSIVGAHQAVSSLTTGDDWAQAITTVSLSDKYARARTYAAPPTGAGIYSVVCRTNKPMRLTQRELEAHTAWRGFSGHTDHPAMNGWLAVPLVGRSGNNLGLLQLSDRYEGEFTAGDEAVMIQLAQLASVAVENARLYDELREQDRRKDEFLATLAHELRNPLAPIRTGLAVLQHASTTEAQAVRTREMMERQLVHLVRMVDDLLDISRVTLGKLELKRELVELSTIIESALETTRPLVEQGTHQLELALPAQPIPLDADPTRLAQVLANLVNNAAKYTPPGGQITVAARIEGAWVTIRITDTGIGIPDEMLPRVFDMFTQVGRSNERAQGGLGIGLTLVRRLVEMHGGTVHAESAGAGQGSSFVVRLPIATPVAPQLAPRAVRTSAAPLRVVVVDDNVDAAEMLGMLLQLHGHEVRVAHTGPEGVELITSAAPQLVFLDIGLPGLDGYEVARQVRATAGLAQPYLVALTGWGTDEDRRLAHAAGFDRHLVKPVDAARLDEVLATFSKR